MAMITPTFAHRKTHLHGTLETSRAIRHPTVHTSPQPPNREQARSETVEYDISIGTQHTCSRLEPRGSSSKKLAGTRWSW